MPCGGDSERSGELSGGEKSGVAALACSQRLAGRRTRGVCECVCVCFKLGEKSPDTCVNQEKECARGGC